MNSEQCLDRYTVAMNALNNHIEQNKEVFDAHKVFIETLIDVENDLRDAVASDKHGIANTEFKVVLTPQTQTYADIEEVDKLIVSGEIKVARENIVKTVERPAHISIRNIKD